MKRLINDERGGALTINEVPILEIAGYKPGGQVNLIVKSHVNMTDRVVLQWGGGNPIVVSADELQRAIVNACNAQ